MKLKRKSKQRQESDKTRNRQGGVTNVKRESTQLQDNNEIQINQGKVWQTMIQIQ